MLSGGCGFGAYLNASVGPAPVQGADDKSSSKRTGQIPPGSDHEHSQARFRVLALGLSMRVCAHAQGIGHDRGAIWQLRPDCCQQSLVWALVVQQPCGGEDGVHAGAVGEPARVVKTT